MPAQVLSTTENNFTKGLLTEFTGLNFPENAATDTDNCIYTLVGDVVRREGFDYESNFTLNAISRTNSAVSTYKWNNVGGDGLTQIVVQQTGGTLYFYTSSAATILSPLSTKKLVSTVSITNFLAFGNTFDISKECQFADGNGYLFVYHPQCDPFYCSYAAGVITAAIISLQIRDFAGIEETIPVNSRPSALTQEHLYNLTNQGWTAGSPWSAVSPTLITIVAGVHTFTVPAGLPISNGDIVLIENNHPFNIGSIPYTDAGTVMLSGTVTGYTGTVVTINCTYVNPIWNGEGPGLGDWMIIPTNHGYITTWNAAEGNYPSNADVWWYFKNAGDIFDPATTQPSVSLSTGNAPQGHYLLNPFRQTRSALSGISGLTDITTTVRPRTGTWFQGRVWYTGVDASQVASGDAIYTTWTENIYFSQIVQTQTDFGTCYQTNDPTSENLFDLLPTDGGVIQIQGCGSIYKLFPLMNALLVFAANGVWYISGSQGIGFAANDYSVVKLSSVKSISGTSFVDIQGLPMFWNEEGIYKVEPAKQGQGLLNSPLHVNPLEVTPLTVGTIQTFYDSIPLQSKLYVRGAYDPINYTVQWIYKSVNETSVTDRYTYDSVLCLNTYNSAFYPYSLNITGSPSINSIIYVSSPGGSTAPNSVFKYLVHRSGNFTFAEERDDNFVDWASSGTSINYISYFVTGFKLHGGGQHRFQMPYIYMYSRLDGAPVGYKIQSQWDYAISGNSGRWSTSQLINIDEPNFVMAFRRHRLRGQGLVLQIKVTSSDGVPFDIMGWSAYETQNAGV